MNIHVYNSKLCTVYVEIFAWRKYLPISLTFVMLIFVMNEDCIED